MTTFGSWAFHTETSYAGLWGDLAAAGQAPHEPIPLPEPRPLALALDGALAQRVSCRRFSADPLELEALSALLAAAYGSGPDVEFEGATFRPRPVPSAGGTYPLEVHILAEAVSGLERRSFRYASDTHALVPTGPGLLSTSAEDLFLGQPYIASAAAFVVLGAALMRTTSRYGDRGYRYVLFEAGHAAQNLMLAAAALDLGSLALGGFFDDALAAILRLPPEIVPLYGIALGPATTSDANELRQPEYRGPDDTTSAS